MSAPIYYCKDCHTNFKRKLNYETHLISTKHKNRVSKVLIACSFCNKSFSHTSSLYRHKTNCIHSKTTETLQKENAELRKKIEDLERSKNNNTNIQNIENQNNTNNIKININCFGNENMDYITDKVILQCISKVYGSIPMIIERIHFDPEHPENNNVKIPNKKLPHAQIMTDNDKWKLVDRNDTIHSMIDNGYSLLDETFQEKGHVLSNNQQKHFKNFQTKYEDGDKDTIKNIKDKVELLVINKTR